MLSGALKDTVGSTTDGWTWEQMLAMETESAILADNGKYWGERALSALLIGGGFRLTLESVDPAEAYMAPVISYASSGKVTFVPAVDGSPAGQIPYRKEPDGISENDHEVGCLHRATVTKLTKNFRIFSQTSLQIHKNVVYCVCRKQERSLREHSTPKG